MTVREKQTRKPNTIVQAFYLNHVPNRFICRYSKTEDLKFKIHKTKIKPGKRKLPPFLVSPQIKAGFSCQSPLRALLLSLYEKVKTFL